MDVDRVLSFEVLNSLSISELQQIPTSRLFNSYLLKNNLKNRRDGDSSQVYMHGLKFGFFHGRLLEMNETLLSRFLCNFTEFIYQLADLLPSSHGEEHEEKIVELIHGYGSLLTHFKNVVRNNQIFEKIQLLIDSGFSILLKLYDKISKISDTWTKKSFLMSNLQSCHFTLIWIVAENTKCFENERFYKVQIGLCNLGKYFGLLDIKCLSDTWKCVSKLAIINAIFIQMHYSYDDDKKDCVRWLEESIDSLSSEIRHNIKSIYDQGDLQPSDKIEKILKINSFYMRLLVNFSSTYDHNYFQAVQSTFLTGITIFSTPSSFKNLKLLNMIEQYLSVGFMTLLNSIYKNPTLLKNICEFEPKTSEEASGFFTIAFKVIEKYSSNNEVYILQDIEKTIDLNITDKLFCVASKWPGTVLTKLVYDKLVEMVATITIQNIANFSDQKFFDVLFKNLLRDNLICANLCADIICCVCRFLSAESRYEMLIFLEKLSADSRDIISYHPNDVVVRTLTKQIFNFQTDANKSRFLSEKQLNKENSMNKAMHILRTVQNSEAIELDKIRNFLENPNSLNYYNLVKFLGCNRIDLSQENILLSLEDLLKKLISLLSSNVDVQDEIELLVSTTLQFCKNEHVMHFKSLKHLLNEMLAIMIKENSILSIYFFIHRLPNINLENWNGIDQKCSPTFNYYLQKFSVSSNLSVNLNDKNVHKYLDDVFLRQYVHKCNDADNYSKRLSAELSPREIVSKRIKVSAESDRMHRFLLEVNKLFEDFDIIEPSDCEKRQVKEIVNSLNNLLNRS